MRWVWLKLNFYRFFSLFLLSNIEKLTFFMKNALIFSVTRIYFDL